MPGRRRRFDTRRRVRWRREANVARPPTAGFSGIQAYEALSPRGFTQSYGHVHTPAGAPHAQRNAITRFEFVDHGVQFDLRIDVPSFKREDHIASDRDSLIADDGDIRLSA